MKQWVDTFLFALFLYLIISLGFWAIRMRGGMDCHPRYIDYAFPLTLLHCERK